MRISKVLASIAAAAFAAGGSQAVAQVTIGPNGAGGYNAYERVGTNLLFSDAASAAEDLSFPGWTINGVEVVPAGGASGHLVTLTGPEEDANLGGWTGWIGYTDDENFGAAEGGNQAGWPVVPNGQEPANGERGWNWAWIDGTPNTYHNWNGDNEPNDAGGNEDYAERLGSGLWNDLTPDAHTRASIVEYDLEMAEDPLNFVVDVQRGSNGLLEGTIAAQAAMSGTNIPGVNWQVYEKRVVDLAPTGGETLPGMFVEVYMGGNTGNGAFFRDTPMPEGDWSAPNPTPFAYFSVPDSPSWGHDSPNGHYYPQTLIDLGFAANQDNYRVRATGEIFLDPTENYFFRDGVDDYTLLEIDINRDGDFDDPDEIIIDDNAWTGWTGLDNNNGGVAPGNELLTFVDEEGWYPIRFGMQEGGGGDQIHLMWNIETGNSPDGPLDIGGVDWYTVDGSVLRHTLPDQLPPQLLEVLIPYGNSTEAAGDIGMFGSESVGEVGGDAVPLPRSLNFNDNNEHTLLIEAQIGGVSKSVELALDAVAPGDGGGGCTGPLAALGDINCDDSVDLADFNILKANFNTSADAAVPEPSTLALLGLGGLAAAVFARRRK